MGVSMPIYYALAPIALGMIVGTHIL